MLDAHDDELRLSTAGGRPPKRTDVVITGMGTTTPLGGDVHSTWAALLAGESGISTLEEPWAEQLPVRIAGSLHKDPASVVDRVQRRRLDRSQEVALIAAREAWTDAGAPAVDPVRLAVVVGTGVGGALTMLDQDDRLEELGARLLSPFTIPRLMPNGAAAVVSLEVGARAGTHAPTSACASGAEAIALGAMLIRAGRADVVVAGGTDACLHPLSIGGFARMGALSTRNDTPHLASRPFDRDRDGFVMAEGAGVVVLERADFAAERGAQRHAVLAGFGITSDAHDMTTPAIEGQTRALDQALRDAEIGPEDVTHVNAHATGTPTGDLAEAEALRLALGTHPQVTATKSSTGHLLGAAGAVEAVFTVLSLQGRVLPAIRNLGETAPGVDLDLVTGEPREWTPSGAALSTSFGFGGHNVVLALTQP